MDELITDTTRDHMSGLDKQRCIFGMGAAGAFLLPAALAALMLLPSVRSALMNAAHAARAGLQNAAQAAKEGFTSLSKAHKIRLIASASAVAGSATAILVGTTGLAAAGYVYHKRSKANQE